MKAGSLRNIITIQQTTQTRNDAGEIVNTWATYISPWANISPLQGREFWAAQQVQNEQAIRIRIRYASGVNVRMRVLYNQRAWDIKSVSNVATRNRETEIIAVLQPDEYRQFAYSVITCAGTAGNGTFTWSTTFYASSIFRIKESTTEIWTTRSESDTTTRVLSHTATETGIKANTTYNVAVWGANANGWSPGWSATKTFSTDADKAFSA